MSKMKINTIIGGGILFIIMVCFIIWLSSNWNNTADPTVLWWHKFHILTWSVVIITVFISVYIIINKWKKTFHFSKTLTSSMSIILSVASLSLPFYLFQIQAQSYDVNLSLTIQENKTEILSYSNEKIIYSNFFIDENQEISTTRMNIQKTETSGNVKNIYVIHFAYNDIKKPIINDFNNNTYTWGTGINSNRDTFLKNYNTITCLNSTYNTCKIGVALHDYDLFSFSPFFIVIEGANGSKQILSIISYSAGYVLAENKKNKNTYSKVKVYSEVDLIGNFSLNKINTDFFENVEINTNIRAVCKNIDYSLENIDSINSKCNELEKSSKEDKQQKFKTLINEQIAEIKTIFNFK